MNIGFLLTKKIFYNSKTEKKSVGLSLYENNNIILLKTINIPNTLALPTQNIFLIYKNNHKMMNQPYINILKKRPSFNKKIS
jgi:hypothetical protein